MKYLKDLKKDNSVNGWNVNVGQHSIESIREHRRYVFEFFEYMDETVFNYDKLTWVTPGSLKHLIEYYSRNNGGSPDRIQYCSRDMCTATAIAFGLPVKLKEDKQQNEIGLHLTKRQYNNIWHNIANNEGAWDLENAMVNPSKFELTDFEHQCLWEDSLTEEQRREYYSQSYE